MFRNRDRRQPLAVADAHARAVLAAFDDALARAVPALTPPTGKLRPAARARAAAALRTVEESLATLESHFAEATAHRQDWHRLAERATAEGREDLAAQALHRTSEAEASAAAYAAEIAAARALVRGWSAHVGDPSPPSDLRVDAT